MGHYYADMMCDTCRNISCTCPKKPDPVRWLIDIDFSVLSTAEFDKKHATVMTKYGPVDGMPLLHRYRMPHFDSKEEALAKVPEQIQKAIDGNIAHKKMIDLTVKRLKKQLKEICAQNSSSPLSTTKSKEKSARPKKTSSGS